MAQCVEVQGYFLYLPTGLHSKWNVRSCSIINVLCNNLINVLISLCVCVCVCVCVCLWWNMETDMYTHLSLSG